MVLDRVYKNYDQEQVMQKTCHDVLSEIGNNDNKLRVAKELEKIALSDEYFIEKLYPNIDFYSGITLSAMGFPTRVYSIIWTSQNCWLVILKEMMVDKSARIGRPR